MGQDTDNVRGHRARLERLIETRPRDEAMRLYVGGGHGLSIGHREKEAIARYAELSDAAIVDIGCGIGRLTRHLIEEPIGSYLGTDVVPEVIAEARQLAAGDARFRFELVDSITIPAEDNTADVVAGSR